MNGVILLAVAYLVWVHAVRPCVRRPEFRAGVRDFLAGRRTPHADLPRRIGWFLILYAVAAAVVVAGLTTVGINMMLVTSFLSFPLWIVVAILAWKASRYLQ